MQYVIVDAKEAAQLVLLVNMRIELGWVPLGGVSISYDGGNRMGIVFAQAMTKGQK